MKNTIKVISLAALVAASLGLASFTGGCASTATKESTGEMVDDSGITAKVKVALVKDPVVKALDVKVETFKGVVQLSGFVNTAAEKSQAGTVAAAVPGVTDVKNNLVVK
jgi:hyperosmotically inducible periplasmic protein